jgi:heme/copper-type cytochrome/quinol oxidase subunit 4
MGNLSQARLSLTWLLLSVITLMSWWIGMHQGSSEIGIVVFVTIILIAVIKVRVIFWEFMEVRTAPVHLQRMADAWLGLLLASLVIAYLIASRFASQSLS